MSCVLQEEKLVVRVGLVDLNVPVCNYRDVLTVGPSSKSWPLVSKFEACMSGRGCCCGAAVVGGEGVAMGRRVPSCGENRGGIATWSIDCRVAR